MKDTYWENLSFEKKTEFLDRCRNWLEDYNKNKKNE